MDKVVHFEIPFEDKERAQKFYKQLFRWKINEIPGMPEYDAIETVKKDENDNPLEPGAINGGMMEKSDTAPAPVIVINVKSIDSVLKMVESLGGTIVTQVQEIMDMGLYCRIQDSEGNIIGLWEDIKKDNA